MIYIPMISFYNLYPFSFSTIYFTISNIRCLTKYLISIFCIFRFLNELRIYNKNISYKICDIEFSRFPFSSGSLFLFILDFLWIDYIIPSTFCFVNTFYNYFLLFFIIYHSALNCLIFIYLF